MNLERAQPLFRQKMEQSFGSVLISAKSIVLNEVSNLEIPNGLMATRRVAKQLVNNKPKIEPKVAYATLGFYSLFSTSSLIKSKTTFARVSVSFLEIPAASLWKRSSRDSTTCFDVSPVSIASLTTFRSARV